MNQRHTFVTVCHEVDVPLLRLQARSFARYVQSQPPLIDWLIVIGNPDLSTLPVDELRREYGVHADKVEFVDGRAIANLTNAGGWWSQQLLKLLIANRLVADRYTVLDAKHHLVFPLYGEHLDNPHTGLPRMRFYGYRAEHPLRQRLLAQLEYFGLPASHVDGFLATTPPFTFWKRHVHGLIDYLVERERGSFSAAFLRRQMTEFFAYGCCMLHSGCRFQDWYSLDQPLSPMIWKHSADVLGCLMEIGQSEQHQLPFFAVHRGAIKNFDDAAREAVAQFWCRACLFETTAAARQFLEETANAIPA